MPPCGKSTLLNVAAGLLEPTEGDISRLWQRGRRPNSIFWEDLASNLWDKSLILFGRGSWIRIRFDFRRDFKSLSHLSSSL
jgi:energy-coupling factor transporter ATP-binding protein EcfA2